MNNSRLDYEDAQPTEYGRWLAVFAIALGLTTAALWLIVAGGGR